MASPQPPRPMQAPPPMGLPSAPRPPAPPSSSSAAYALFPPIPAPLQRLFDRVPLVTYPANALPGDEDAGDAVPSGPDGDLPTLYVFIDPADAARGRASFNPTCLKWQTVLRFAGVPVRLAASSNHASPTGALPFLQPPRRRRQAELPEKPEQPEHPRRPHRTAATPPPRPVPAHELLAYAKTATARMLAQAQTPEPADAAQPPALDALAALAALHPRAPAYQALLDTSLRRAWLHAVYLDENNEGDESGAKDKKNWPGWWAWAAAPAARGPIAARLYAHAASASPLVRAALARQLQAAAAAEVWGGAQPATATATAAAATAVAHIYRDAAAALSALSTLLLEEEEENGDGGPYFFGSAVPTIFDAAVFSYTHLLLEEEEDDDGNDDNDDDNDSGPRRFRWHNRTLPDMVRAHPALVRHRARIVAQYWPEAGRRQAQPRRSNGAVAVVAEAAPSGAEAPTVADSVSWVKV